MVIDDKWELLKFIVQLLISLKEDGTIELKQEFEEHIDLFEKQKVQIGYKDYNYKKLFHAVWLQMPDVYKNHIINNDDSITSLLYMVLEVQNKEKIKIIEFLLFPKLFMNQYSSDDVMRKSILFASNAVIYSNIFSRIDAIVPHIEHFSGIDMNFIKY